GYAGENLQTSLNDVQPRFPCHVTCLLVWVQPQGPPARFPRGAQEIPIAAADIQQSLARVWFREPSELRVNPAAKWRKHLDDNRAQRHSLLLRRSKTPISVPIAHRPADALHNA